MKRISISFFAVILLAASRLPLFAAAQPLEGSRPNIILVMTDDQGMGDLSCMGKQVLKTPNIDHFCRC